MTDRTIGGAEGTVYVVSTNPLLLVDNTLPAAGPSPHIERAYLPPWGVGDIFFTRATALRVGNLAFFSGPGEPYPSILFSLDQAVQEAHAVHAERCRERARLLEPRRVGRDRGTP